MDATINNTRNKKTLYLSFGSTLVFLIYITFVLNPVSECFKLDSESNSLGLSFSYNVEMVQNFFAARTQEQLLCYSQFLKIWDVIFALIYTLMYGSWILYLLNKKIYLIAPIIGMISDWSENFLELLMIENWITAGSISQILISVGSNINSFKWIMSSLTYLLIIIGIIIAIKSFLTKKSN